jgi:hypothetical protein
MESPGRPFFLMMIGMALLVALAAAVGFPPGLGQPPPAFAAGEMGAAKASGENDGKEEEASDPLVKVEGIPESYGLGEIKPFTVPRRTDKIEYYPCADCHEDEPTNAREREMTEDHEEKKLDHGGGRFWCLTCHGSKNKNTLTSLKGKPISFDKPFLLCGQCHFQRQKDWYMGGHGKRVGAWPGRPHEVPVAANELKVEDRERIGVWKGERQVKVCTECHDPHSPSIKPFKPSPPPGVRKGLVRRQPPENGHAPIWVRLLRGREGH